jgi:hypothetical protein
MTYLQLHDGPSYGNYSRFTLAGCDPADIKAQFIPQSKAAWALSMDKNKQYQQIWANAKSLWNTIGTGSKPVYNDKGEITGYQQATKAEVGLAWVKLGIQIGQALKAELDNAGATRLTENAQAIWDQNLWGIQNLCNQDMPTLQANARKCYDALNWWINRQSEVQILYKNTAVGDGRRALDGERRIANRAVVIRQTAFRLITEQIESKGGVFDPNANAGSKVDLSKLIVPAAIALLTLR